MPDCFFSFIGLFRFEVCFAMLFILPLFRGAPRSFFLPWRCFFVRHSHQLEMVAPFLELALDVLLTAVKMLRCGDGAYIDSRVSAWIGCFLLLCFGVL